LDVLFYRNKMDTLDLDQEGQFYPFISTAICENDHILLLLHDDSINPPPLSSYWDIPFNP